VLGELELGRLVEWLELPCVEEVWLDLAELDVPDRDEVTLDPLELRECVVLDVGEADVLELLCLEELGVDE
jgi:hypothetical protein